jgi:hypothetical protein
MNHYEVIVGNVGRIYSGTEYHIATQIYNDSVWRSQNTSGRMSEESVFVMKDDELWMEYIGPAQARS